MISRRYLYTGQRTCHAEDGQEVPCESSGQDASFDVGTPLAGTALRFARRCGHR